MLIQQYHDVNAYDDALEVLRGVAGLMLFAFAEHGKDAKDTILANSIARTSTMLKAIFELYHLDDYQDCWILHRGLMDRLFHLVHLAETNSFQEFEKWSFLQQYAAVRRVQDDPQAPDARLNPWFQLTQEQLDRAKELKRAGVTWRRPNAEDVSHRLNMHFLYRYGYDFASKHVHPLADDGMRDFYSITKLQPAPTFPDERVVLSNSILVGTVIIQAAMNSSSLKWIPALYELLDHLRAFLGKGGHQFKRDFVTIGRAVRGGMAIAEPATAG